MKIIIVGPGAIGCLFAGMLAEAGNDVRLLDKNSERARIIAKQGLRIDHADSYRIVKIKISADPGKMGRADFVFISVKSYDVDGAISHAMPVISSETAVMSLANGCGNVEKIAQVITPDQAICGITSQGSTNLGPGHVRHAGTGPTTISAFVRHQRKKAEQISEILNASKIEACVSDDMAGAVWNKLILSAAINPLSAILNVANGRLLEDAGTRETLRKAALEAASVARAKGIMALPDSEIIESVETVCRETAGNISSMLQDVRNGKQTEIHAITGAIVHEARAAGIKAPVNEMLLARVLDLEKHKCKKKETA